MLRSTIQNGPLLGHLGRLGHGDLVVVADCGLPLPAGVPVVDLALVRGVPSFEQVVNALCDELVIEGAVMASEADDTPPQQVIESRVDITEFMPHEEFKRLSASAKLIVRTGETTPYANVALRCGVDF